MCILTSSSSDNSPCCSKSKMANAVNCFETDPILVGVFNLKSKLCVILAFPYALENVISPFSITPITAPGSLFE